jgi:hypothetical protein
VDPGQPVIRPEELLARPASDAAQPRRDLAIFLISRRCGKVNFGGRSPLYLGYSEVNPSALKLRITSRTGPRW